MCSLSEQDRDLLACTKFNEILGLELQHRCLRNASYSLRAFARDMKISNSYISEIINGKKQPSKTVIQELAGQLNRPEPVCEYFKYLAFAQTGPASLSQFEDLEKSRAIRLEHLYETVKASHRTIGQWDLKTFAVALLLRVQGELRSNEALSKRIGVSVEALQVIIKDLESIGWLEATEDGPISHVRYKEMGDQGSAYHIQHIHEHTLKFALASIKGLSTESRYFYNSYFTMNPDQYEDVCSRMRAFALKTGEDKSDTAEGQEVYTLGTFLFPLTKIPENKL